MSPIKTSDGRLLPSRGPEVCAWIERHCVYGEGDWYGEPVRLREFQRRWIYRLYEFYPEDGRRRYKRALKGVPKGNGKTPEAAWVGAYELESDVHVSPRVLIGAASLKQADLVFGDLRTCVNESATLSELLETFDLQITRREGPGVAERVAAVAGTNDGSRATCLIADELHEWVGKLERVHLVLDGAITKRKNTFSLGISTAGAPSKAVLLKNLYDYGRKLASGEVVDDSFLFEWYEAPEGLDLDEPDEWEMAVRCANPAAGDFLSIEELRSRFGRIPRHEFERYHLNRWVASVEAFLPAGAWDGCAGEAGPPADDSEIVLAFDGSYNRDSTALVGCTLGAERKLFVVDVWERPVGAPDTWVVPRDEVSARVAQAFKRWKVRRMPCDPPGWHEEIERWAEEFGDDVVVYYSTNQRARMSEACSKFYTAVVTNALSHDGDPVLARHLDNAVVKETAEGAYITKDGRGSPNKIDLAVAAVMAHDVAVVLASEPSPEPGLLYAF